MLVRRLSRRGAKKLDLAGLGPGQPDRSLAIDAVAFIHRIVWASQ
jgi:hypothetical protein